ncbi:MAG: hypothetical protein ACPGJE_07485 [Wenzhouxiangellaceae bacterium]
MTENVTRNRLILVLLFVLFFAPIVIALLLNSKWVDWSASPGRAHGELLRPVVPLGEFALTDALGQQRTQDDLADLWIVVMTRTGDCDSECRESLLLMHSIRLAQDRRAPDAALMLLSDQILPDPLLNELTATDATWRVFDGDAGARLLRRFPGAASGTFYIVDPEGNIIERFAPDADPTGIRKDLDRLMTWTVRE